MTPKPKRRASGPTQSKESRRAAGLVRVEVWLIRAAAKVLDADAAAKKSSRREVIERWLMER
jgi:hypothetical protein